MIFGHDHEAELLRQILHELRAIRQELKPHYIKHFHIRRKDMLPIAPGFSPQYTATPVPAGTFPAPGNVPTWTSSDNTNAPIAADSTGLVATVAIPATATVGASFTLTVSYTNADGTLATGTLTQTIVAAPPADITSFTIAQTA